MGRVDGVRVAEKQVGIRDGVKLAGMKEVMGRCAMERVEERRAVDRKEGAGLVVVIIMRRNVIKGERVNQRERESTQWRNGEIGEASNGERDQKAFGNLQALEKQRLKQLTSCNGHR